MLYYFYTTYLLHHISILLHNTICSTSASTQNQFPKGYFLYNQQLLVRRISKTTTNRLYRRLVCEPSYRSHATEFKKKKRKKKKIEERNSESKCRKQKDEII